MGSHSSAAVKGHNSSLASVVTFCVIQGQQFLNNFPDFSCWHFLEATFIRLSWQYCVSINHYHVDKSQNDDPGLESNLWKGRAIFILQKGHFFCKILTSMGNCWWGNNAKTRGNGGHDIRGLSKMLGPNYPLPLSYHCCIKLPLKGYRISETKEITKDQGNLLILLSRSFWSWRRLSRWQDIRSKEEEIQGL